jgi:hypothetical protein
MANREQMHAVLFRALRKPVAVYVAADLPFHLQR